MRKPLSATPFLRDHRPLALRIHHPGQRLGDNSDELLDAIAHAMKQAQRLGLELSPRSSPPPEEAQVALAIR